MCDVYWKTVCRLAVTDSKRPAEGFFPPSPILMSVRVPSLETEVQKQWENENTSCGCTAEEDEGKKGEESEIVIPTNIALVGQVGDRHGAEHSFAQGLDDCDNHTRLYTRYPDIARMATKKREFDNQERRRGKESEDHAPLKKYITLPSVYAVDVDGGLLITRGWVLQERLLSPRTIHFTKHHIYFEDQDEICGEDWIRRYFTWPSSIVKTSKFTPIELFLERRFNSAEHTMDNLHTGSIWSQRNRLAAIAGLVKKKKEFTRSGSANNLLGLWEHSLHVELAWVARREAKLKFLGSLSTVLGLDRRRKLSKPTSLTVDIAVRELHEISAENSDNEKYETANENGDAPLPSISILGQKKCRLCCGN
ncbi:hypothetical protein BDW67DRAFT_184105 [Aspergillus spinulosporus]